MADTKRYYWLRLHDDFFDSKRIKKLRKLAGGDTYTIIYLKMQLLAMKTDGVITFTGLESDIADELALDLDESADDVRITLNYLLSVNLCETSDNINYFLPYAIENTGSETASAQRVREFRTRQKTLQCNNDVTLTKRLGNVEIEKEIEKEIEIEIEKEIDIGDIPKESPKTTRFTPPTLAEVQDYCHERSNGLDAQYFIDYYSARGWMIGKNKIKDWRACVRTWERNNNVKPKANEQSLAERWLNA